MKVRYCNGFPIIHCNINRLAHSISSIRSHSFHPFLQGFDTKFTTVVARIKVRGVGVCCAPRNAQYRSDPADPSPGANEPKPDSSGQD